MKFKSPSPKVLQTLVAVVFVIVATISYQSYQNNKGSENSQPQKSLSVSIENQNTNNVDSDNDQLEDWEEVLWGTDPNNPDSDGDGTLDGVEVRLNRDPNVAGPDDDLSGIDSDNLSFSSSTIDQNSFTLETGVDIFREALLLGTESGENLNEDEIISRLESGADSMLDSQNTYSLENLNIIDNSSEKLEKYFNNFISIINSEFGILENTEISQDDTNILMLEIYKGLHERLSAIPVPKVLSNAHLKYINSIADSVYYYEIVLNEENDPLLAYYAIPKFKKSTEEANIVLGQIVTYLENNGIISNE